MTKMELLFYKFDDNNLPQVVPLHLGQDVLSDGEPQLVVDNCRHHPKPLKFRIMHMLRL